MRTITRSLALPRLEAYGLAAALGMFALAVMPGEVQAQEALLEGRIESIVSNPDGSATMTVMGVQVRVEATDIIESPSATLTLAQLLNPAPLPGRASQPGFVGGTAIVDGLSVLNGPVDALSVFVEPAENVLFGRVTLGPPSLEVEGLPVVLLPDALTEPRIPLRAVQNSFGFNVLFNTITLGSFVGAEGYFDESGNLRAFLIEADGAALANPGIRQISGLRVECTNTGELEVRGATVRLTTELGQARIFRRHPTIVGAMQRLGGNFAVTADAEFPQFGLYRAIIPVPVFPVPRVCPTEIKAQLFSNTTAGASLWATTGWLPVDIPPP